MIIAPPTGPDVSLAAHYVIPVVIMGLLSLFLCSCRIYTRCRPKFNLKLDDYLILAAQFCSFFGIVCTAVAVSNGWGRQSYYVPAEKVRRARIASFTLQLLWSHGIVLVRLSIAASLWPLSRNKFWRGTLATLCIIQVILYCGWITVALGNCRPLHSFWDPIEAKCWPTKYTTNYAWGSASFFIVMEFTMALMPIRLIRTLNRPRSEKILVGCLMALGLLGTITAGAKMSTFPSVYQGDPLSATVNSSLLAKLEEQIGIICACLPTLKGPLQRILVRLGAISSQWGGSLTRPSFVVSLQERNGPATRTTREVSPGSETTLDRDRTLDGENTDTEAGEGHKLESSRTFSGSERTVCNKDSRATLHSSGF